VPIAGESKGTPKPPTRLSVFNEIEATQLYLDIQKRDIRTARENYPGFPLAVPSARFKGGGFSVNVT
jgi:hypothetical protein